jgi:hypothetical protein
MVGATSIRDRYAARRGQIAAGKAKGLRPYKWKSGKTKFRIVPAVDPLADWDRRIGKTYLKGFDGTNLIAIGDREITFGETDRVREMLWDAYRQAPDEATKKHYKDMIASPRVIFNALILDDKDVNPTEPQLIEVSETAFDTILAQFEAYTDMDPEYDLAGKETGHVFTCEKTGSGMDTKYTFLATPMKAPLKAEIIAKAHDLDAFIQGQFEGLEQKAFEALARINSTVGIQTTVPAGLLTSSAPATTTPAASQNVSAAAVTTALEPEDAEYEAVVADVEAALNGGSDSPFESEPAPAVDPVAAAQAALAVAQAQAAAAQAAAQTKAVAPAAVTPTVTPTPTAPAAAAPAESDEIEDILAGLA